MIKKYLNFYIDVPVLLFSNDLIPLRYNYIKLFNPKYDKIVLKRFESLTEEQMIKLETIELQSDSSTEEQTVIERYANIIKNLCELGVDVFGLIDKKLAINYDLLRR